MVPEGVRKRTSVVEESHISMQMGVTLLAALAIGGVAVGVTRLLGRRHPLRKNVGGEDGKGAPTPAEATPTPPVERQPDALYQRNRIVARAVNAEVDEAAQTVHFEEFYSSDDLVLADEAEFQKYKILVETVDHATKIDRNALHRGRVLRGITAKILGHCEE